MAYTREDWIKRLVTRFDLCAQVTHLTREATRDGEELTAMDVVIKILRERTIKGSTTGSGFIVGSTPAVCFQDAPPYALAQNVNFEKEIRRSTPSYRPKYVAIGLMFPKQYVYRSGGRPVIYDRTCDAKKYVAKDEWWRIVSFDLSDRNAIIDWTHEREWRMPGDFEFEIGRATVVVHNTKQFREFQTKAAQGGEDVASQVQGILPLGSIFV